MIEPGTVLIQKDAAHPECFVDGNEVCPADWKTVRKTLSPVEFEAELSRTGWTFFFLATPLRVNAYGFNPVKRLATAMTGIVASALKHGCNSVQIDGVSNHSFLGIPYVSVSAHPRHLQRSLMFVPQ